MPALEKDVMKLAKKRKLVGASVVLYAIALALPAFSYTNIPGAARLDLEGWQALTYGWMPAFLTVIGMPFGVGSLAWFANPLLCWSWFASAFNSRFTALCTSAAALFAAALFPSMHELNAGDNAWREIAVGWGYFAWLASIIMAGYIGARTGDVELGPIGRNKNAR